MSYVLIFLAGALLGNAIPHLVSGLRGDPFPTPFAKPPGIGDSPPLVNFLWGVANLGLALALGKRLATDNVPHGLIAAAAGFLVIGVFAAWHFGKVRSQHRD